MKMDLRTLAEKYYPIRGVRGLQALEACARFGVYEHHVYLLNQVSGLIEPLARHFIPTFTLVTRADETYLEGHTFGSHAPSRGRLRTVSEKFDCFEISNLFTGGWSSPHKETPVVVYLPNYQ